MRAIVHIITLGTFIVTVALFRSGDAGTIRHDRPDALFTSLASQPAFSPVGKLTTIERGVGTLASGTLIAGRWVVTAAHVIDGIDGHGAGIDRLQFDLGGQTHHADEWFVHPNWSASGGEDNLFAGWDIGLIRLSVPINDVEPARVFEGNDELGSVATIVGFGATGTGLSGSLSNSAGVKRAGQNVVDIAGTRRTPGSQLSIDHDRMLAIDFDRPGTTLESTLGSGTALDLEYLTAGGDSGGGLFIEQANQHWLAGVTSLGSTLDLDANSDYGDRASFTRLSQFVPWIEQTVQSNTPQLPVGDYNGDGSVEQADLDLVLLTWGRDAASVPPAWINDLPSGLVDQKELDNVLLNWGRTSVLAASVNGVPEPKPICIICVTLLVAVAIRLHRE